MSMQLAAVYDTPAGEGWVPFEFEEEGPRLGLLTHVSFLAANSHSVRSRRLSGARRCVKLFYVSECLILRRTLTSLR